MVEMTALVVKVMMMVTRVYSGGDHGSSDDEGSNDDRGGGEVMAYIECLQAPL